MIIVLLFSLLVSASACCVLLSLLPILAEWKEYLQLGALTFCLTGIGALIHCTFKNC